MSCQCGCQCHDVWAPLFYSHNDVFILPKFLRRHKGRIIPNVTVTTRIRPSTYHALYKRIERTHEHTLNPLCFFSHSVNLFAAATELPLASLPYKLLEKERWGPHLSFVDSLSIQALKHGTALTRVWQIFIVTRKNVTLLLRSVSGTERQNTTLPNLIQATLPGRGKIMQRATHTAQWGREGHQICLLNHLGMCLEQQTRLL